MYIYLLVTPARTIIGVCLYIYMIVLLLVIFKTVVSAMDIFVGHTWDISNWSLFAILVIRLFCWSNLCLVTDDCRHDWGNMIQGFCLKSTTTHLVMTVISVLVLDYLQRIYWFFMGRLLELCCNLGTLVHWRFYRFYSPAIFVENLPFLYGENFSNYAVIFGTLVLWGVYLFYSPAIFLETGPLENLVILYGETFRNYAIIFRTLVCWEVYWFYSPAIFLKTFL